MFILKSDRYVCQWGVRYDITVVMPRASAEAKNETRQRLLLAAGQGFRTHGYGGVGVDGVAKDAGVTSGAFYAHFGSKAAIFREALAEGLRQLRDGIGIFRRRHGPHWLRRFATWYLSAERRANLAGSCALPTLSLEAARADDATRHAYDEHLRAVLKELQAGLGGTRREDHALAILALLCGGMSMAHAVHDPRLGARIAHAVIDAITTLGERPHSTKENSI